MPIVFVHGVTVRDTNPNYRKDLTARDELFEDHVLKPLATKDSRFQEMAIVNSYWGKHGVTFRWKLASLPQVSFLEGLGSEEGQTPESDFEIAQTVQELGGRDHGDASHLENLGGHKMAPSPIIITGALKRAAEKDLVRFVEAVLSPLLLSELRIIYSAAAAPEDEGVLQALLATAALDVASDRTMQDAVMKADSDVEVINLLKSKIKQRFEQLARDRFTPTPATTSGKQLESLGEGWLDNALPFIDELFNRALDAPRRAATTPILALRREKLHHALSLFTGDVFVYLARRGDQAAPGPIVKTVLDDIKNAPMRHSNEPLIVVTHSLGGNILYDILTYYDTSLKVDFWASIGGQVAQFEEMKIFRASDDTLKAPNKVSGLKPRVGYWLNVYDAVDIVGFKAAPVFADIDADVKYNTGAGDMKSHSEYFGRASFYQLLRSHLEEALL